MLHGNRSSALTVPIALSQPACVPSLRTLVARVAVIVAVGLSSHVRAADSNEANPPDKPATAAPETAEPAKPFEPALANKPQPPKPWEEATAAEKIKLPEGFVAERLYSVPSQTQGSWVAMTADPQGRLITSDQSGSLYRLTFANLETGELRSVQNLPLNIGLAHGLLYAFDSLYAVVNGNKEIPTALYRIRDTNGDGEFDDVQKLRDLHGTGEHGPHSIILAPDGKSLYLCAGNHTDLPELHASRIPTNWNEDLLLPRMWDARGHAAGKLAPGGWICQIDPEGKEFTLVAIGFRNIFDIAFSPEGQLFTYDSDMEWDIGTPWYRPTRVIHVTSGGEFGWRSGTGKWPTYFPDSLPATLDIGPGSPTGITFGTNARFPAKYQQALFIADWSYGLIYAVHLTPDGASYTAEKETFASATPLPVTDMLVHPSDGSFYFLIGGRSTQSGLYRIRYTGKEKTEPVKRPEFDAGTTSRELRAKFEAMHLNPDPAELSQTWPFLGHSDRFVRYAARLAVEKLPADTWRDMVLQTHDPEQTITAAVALARSGTDEDAAPLIDKLSKLSWSELTEAQRLELLRAYALVFVRLGAPSEELRATVQTQLTPRFPSNSWPLDGELARLLNYLESPEALPITLGLLDSASTQEQQLHYAFILKSRKTGWTPELRRNYFAWFQEAIRKHRGGASFTGFVVNVQKEAVGTLTDAEQQEFADVLALSTESADAALEQPKRDFVRKWTTDEVLQAAEKDQGPRDLARGQALFTAANCYKCHRFQGQGGINGPDLTAAGGRFNLRNLIESLVEPSKVVSDQYQMTTFVLTSGQTVVGRVINLHKTNMSVMTNMLEPSKLTNVSTEKIDEVVTSNASMMPNGLLDTFSAEEILDLLAFLRSGVEVAEKHQATGKAK